MEKFEKGHVEKTAVRHDPYHAERGRVPHGGHPVDQSLSHHRDGSMSFASPYGHQNGGGRHHQYDGGHHQYGGGGRHHQYDGGRHHQQQSDGGHHGRHHHQRGDGPRPNSVHMEKGTPISGQMSWYNEGRTTASGEPFNPHAMTMNKEYGVPEVTGAHRDAAFGTKFLIKDGQGNPKLVVRINDNGPADWTKRNLDINEAGADILKLKGPGHRYYTGEVI